MKQFKYRFEFSVLGGGSSQQVIGACAVQLRAIDLSGEDKHVLHAMATTGMRLCEFLEGLNYMLDITQQQISDSQPDTEETIRDDTKRI